MVKGKGNDGTGNIPERDLWETDKRLWEDLNNQYKFSFDCCANERNTKCFMWSDCLEKEGLNSFKGHICWMNPPFSKALLMFKEFFRAVPKGVAIYRCDNMETRVWQEVILPNASWIFFPKGRVNYEGMEGKGSRFPSALIGFNVEPPKEIKGRCVFPELNEGKNK